MLDQVLEGGSFFLFHLRRRCSIIANNFKPEVDYNLSTFHEPISPPKTKASKEAEAQEEPLQQNST